MPTPRTESQRNDRIQQPRSELKQPQPQTRQAAHPLIVDGPESIRNSHC